MMRRRACEIFAGAALTALLVATPAWAQTTVDHFTCYKARATNGTPRFQARTATVADALRISTVTVKKPKLLCAPTNKAGEDPTAPMHPDHLEDYLAKPVTRFTRLTNQVIADQYGSLRLDLLKPVALQVPTVKSTTATPPTPSVSAVDHFQCYAVKASKGAARFQARPGVVIQDQFGTRTVTVKRPRRLCLPADKNGEEPGAETHLDHLLCYQVKETSQPKFQKRSPLFVNNQFGPETLDALKPLELCLPARRNPVAMPTPSASPSLTPSTTATPRPIPTCAQARTISDPSDLIGGPLARGTLGDFYLANDKIQTVVQKPGRVFFGIGTYGGNIIDADLQRTSGPERDHFEEFIPGINIESTANYTSVQIVNDGADCQPAVLRFTGPDDIFDFVNGSSAIRSLGFTFPASADDRDLPVEVETDYTLATGNAYVKVDTRIRNLDAAPLDIYFVEYVNGSGQVEMWRPAYGFGEPLATVSCPPSTYVPCNAGACDPCNYVAFAGEDGAAGVSYGYIHGVNGSSAVTVSGVTVPALGQDVALVFSGASAPNFHMGPAGAGDTVTITRYFAVGDGSVASIADVRNQIFGIPTGTLQGTVTAGGQPVADADVAVIGTDYPAGPDQNVVDHFRTAADGSYRGTLPAGSYELRVNQDGRLFGSPDPASITITPTLTTTQNFTLPDAGILHVTVTDEAGLPIPAKVQLVGFDPSPDPLNTQDVLGVLTNTTGVFGEQFEDGLVFGIAAVLLADKTGSASGSVEPGSYQLVVSRGPRYSAALQPITITAGAVTTATAQIAKVIDTPGFIGADFHVHSIDSPDSEVTRSERVATMLAEGMDFFTPSDHEFRADFGPTIAEMGVGHLIAVAGGGEITTFDYGHFNAWPVAIDPGQIHGGGVDWGRAGVAAGQDYPSLGSYGLSPAEIFAAAHASTPGNLIQINHMRSFFDTSGLDIDTAESGTGPPQSHTPAAERRLNPAVGNFFDAGFDALELWIGTDGRTGDLDHFVGENLGDWFNLLNQGIRKTGVADSDTHQRRTTQINARTWVASAVNDPALLGAQALTLAGHVKAGRATGANAPFVTVTATAASTSQSAGLGIGQATMLATTNGAVDVTVSVASPLWAEFDRVQFYVNNAPQPFDHDADAATRMRYRVIPNAEKIVGTDFTLTTVNDFPAIPGASHREGTTTLALTGITADTWVVVLVRGTDGVSRPLFPVLPNSLRQAGNTTLADLTDGNLGEDGVLALAFSNPLYIDADNDGIWTPPGVHLTP